MADDAAPALMSEKKIELLNALLSNDPVKFAAEYQQQHQLAPRIQNALHFTDMRNIARGTIMEDLANQFKSKLLEQIPTLDIPQRLTLLQSSLSSLADPQLRSIPQLLLDTHPTDLPPEYYSSILPGLGEEMQEELPAKVRRRCWELSPEQGFRPVAESIIQSYLNHKQVKQAGESFDLNVKRRRDKIEFLGVLKDVLADSKLLLRNFQSLMLERMFNTTNSSSDTEVLCGLYFDVLMLTGPQDRSSLQDVPYLLEQINQLEPLEAFPMHPDTITQQQNMRLIRLDAMIDALYRDFAKHLSPAKQARRKIQTLSPEALHQIIVKLVERIAKRQSKLYKLFFPRVVDEFPALKERYLVVVDNKTMDLKTMLEKQYKSVDEVLEDLQLIYKNCCLFNAANAELCTSAQRFLTTATDYVHEFQTAMEKAEEQQQQQPVLQQQQEEESNGANSPQEISQSCLDYFVSIGDPLFSRKLARLCWELLYFASFNRGKLPRDVPSLRIVAYFLSVAKDHSLLRDIADAFTNKTKLVLPKLEDDFVTKFVTCDLVKFQMLFLLREQHDMTEEQESRVLNDSFLDPTCANVELYWRFLLDLQENDRETHQFLKLYDFLLETSPPVGMVKLLIRKKSNRTPDCQRVLMDKYFLPALEQGGGEVDFRLWELVSTMFATAVVENEQARWANYFTRCIQHVSLDTYSSKQFRRARIGLEDFLQKQEFSYLRQEHNLPAPATQQQQRLSTARGEMETQ